MNEDDEIIFVGEPLPQLAEAHILKDRLVQVLFTSGQKKTVDLAPALASRAIYVPLREDDALFSQMSISPFKDALTWPSPDLEFSALWLDDLPDLP